ncbi:MAG: transporter [Haloferacaceae archaeon]
MAAIDVAMYAAHLLFAGLWAGSVFFVAVAVLPTAMDGTADAGPLAVQTDRLRWITRLSALALLVTGGHTAAQRYTAETLTGSTAGYAVLTMVVLWVAMTGLVEAAGSRLSDGFDAGKVREPARAARPLLLAASAIGVVLLLLGGGLAYL